MESEDGMGELRGWKGEATGRQDETIKEKRRESDRHSAAPGTRRYIGESVPGKRQTRQVERDSTRVSKRGNAICPEEARRSLVGGQGNPALGP